MAAGAGMREADFRRAVENTLVGSPPKINVVRSYDSTSPFGFNMEFRPLGIENWTEKIEGDTTVDVIIDSQTKDRFMQHFDGPFSQIISLVTEDLIFWKRYDATVTEVAPVWSSDVYDSYYVKAMSREKDSRNWRLQCVGLKEYLANRLVIPAARNTINGVVSVADGSQESKPIPATYTLKFTNRTFKGIIAGLIDNANTTQQMPVEYSTNGNSGSSTRTYLVKDMMSVKEAIDNIIDDNGGINPVFDGSFGTRSNINFFFDSVTGLQRGVNLNLNDRSSPITTEQMQIAQNDVVNNLWTIGNASDGNVLIGHKIQSGSTSKILLQRADTSRSDIKTSAGLLNYTVGTLATSGQSVKTATIRMSLTRETLQAFVGNLVWFESTRTDTEDLNGSWIITERQINEKSIEFDLVEIQL